MRTPAKMFWLIVAASAVGNGVTEAMRLLGRILFVYMR